MAKQSKGNTRKSTTRVATENSRAQATTTEKSKINHASTTKSPGSVPSKGRSDDTKTQTSAGRIMETPYEKKTTGPVDERRGKGDDRQIVKNSGAEQKQEKREGERQQKSDEGKKAEGKKQEKRDEKQPKREEKKQEKGEEKQPNKEEKKQEKKSEPAREDGKKRKCAVVKSKPRCGWNDTAHCKWKDGQCVYLPGGTDAFNGQHMDKKVGYGKSAAISNHTDNWPTGFILLLLLALIHFFRH